MEIVEVGDKVWTKDTGEFVEIVKIKTLKDNIKYCTHKFLERPTDIGTRLNDGYTKYKQPNSSELVAIPYEKIMNLVLDTKLKEGSLRQVGSDLVFFLSGGGIFEHNINEFEFCHKKCIDWAFAKGYRLKTYMDDSAYGRWCVPSIIDIETLKTISRPMTRMNSSEVEGIWIAMGFIMNELEKGKKSE